MTFEEAVRLVVADVYENEWAVEEQISDADAIAHVRNTISLQDPAPLGAVTFEDYEDELSEAYKIILPTEEVPA
jgi:hypothetical protein